jgi:hypothetical protein
VIQLIRNARYTNERIAFVHDGSRAKMLGEISAQADPFGCLTKARMCVLLWRKILGLCFYETVLLKVLGGYVAHSVIGNAYT